ncbi:phosphotransferase enzyme family protein [Hirsutella rhossiliensis]|uniref:Phosphotransferase enzyme family domain-containing protein n=1 Tax=Hirsutella rhossiliensis TaxID=111463 RepID=A0A9P8MUR2_9HYPO|nr:phosphotransferase enzyme family domain-containing protein [Hirsutella rhossiliensis]KAH0962528.1 phosphotransferase enzyme family domain-containing protein [Hirsutella rhossiliensis]
MSGALNWAILLKFDDGVEWVFRSPRTRYAVVGDTAACRLLASEAATLKYIRKHTSIPVPEVFHYCVTDQNDIGIPYILMSKAAGNPLATYDWQTYNHERPKPASPTDPVRAMTRDEKGKIMRQLGNYACQLFQLRFATIGSLFEQDGEDYNIEECLSPGHVLHGRDDIEDISRGPYHGEPDYYSSLVSALLLHAERLPMEHHILLAPVPIPQEYSDFTKYRSAERRWNDYAALGGKAESSKNRLQYSIASYLIRDQIIPHLTRPNIPRMFGFPLSP